MPKKVNSGQATATGTKPKAVKTKGATTKTKESEPKVVKPSVRSRVLQALADSTEGMTRGQLAEATGVKKGWSKILGTVTVGKEATSGFISEGLVKASKSADQRGTVYTLTAAGRKAAAKEA